MWNLEPGAKSMDRYVEYNEEIAALERSGLLRELNPVSSRSGPYVTRRGRRLLNLSSNDYLGMAADEELHRSFYAGLNNGNLLDGYGLGSSASRLMTGTTRLCEDLESVIAGRYAKEALVFNSGYHANVGILPAMAGKGDLILSDKLNHASMIDGMRLSRAKFFRYRHLDYGHCADILEKERSKYGRAFIVTESIFSMDGDVADLCELVRIKTRYQAMLYVDEAHAVGVRGATGLGVCEEQGVTEDIDIILGTFGKALASVGAYAVLAPPLKQFLINRMRPFIFTTALPPVVVHWNRTVFDRVAGLDTRRRALRELSNRFRQALMQRGIETRGDSQIVPVIVGPSARAVDMAEALIENGCLALPVRPPTVPANTARLRLSLCANMTWADIETIPDFFLNCRQSGGNEA